MANILQVTEQNFEQEVLHEQLPVLVEFGASWCGPCQTIAPEIESLSRDLAGKAKIVQVDIDQSPLLAQTMGVRSVPTFFVFHQGRPVDGRQGAIRKAEMRALLEPLLPREAGALKPQEAAQLLAAGRITPVDTRAPEVYARTHIEGAVNFPLETIREHIAELDLLEKPPVLYCRTGQESKDLVTQLSQEGVALAYLEGGVLGWEAEGFRLARG